ncbi:MAG TPA: hypothetical protein VF516_43975 [Kofleriaceae bacterium]
MTGVDYRDHPVVRCRCCERYGKNYARGLVRDCYVRAAEAGTLERDFPRRVWRGPRLSTESILDEWASLARDPSPGTTTGDIARRIGLSVEALQQTLIRARRRGDERAIYMRHGRSGWRYGDPTAPRRRRNGG